MSRIYLPIGLKPGSGFRRMFAISIDLRIIIIIIIIYSGLRSTNQHEGSINIIFFFKFNSGCRLSTYSYMSFDQVHKCYCLF